MLRSYQQPVVDDAIGVLRSGGRKLYASPTGSGKSYMELAVLDASPGVWLITPRIEIGVQMLEKAGRTGDPWSERVTTPIRFLHALERGEVAPTGLILDEGHHDQCATWQDMRALAGDPPAVAFTATPFRGTPQATAALLREWGKPHWAITFRDAVAQGHISMPFCSTVPLIDDDVIDVRGGEFVVAQVERETWGKMDQVHAMAGEWMCDGTWDVPTVFCLPSVACARQFAGNDPAYELVTGETPTAARLGAFRRCTDRIVALVQVQVLGEGVDLPIRRLVDLAPAVSPVAWLQRFGRCTRPGGSPHYICCNRNLMRHGYLLDGCLSVAAVREAQSAFPPSRRDSVRRAFGLESLGKLKPMQVPLMSGLTCTGYAVSRVDGHECTEYFALVHPQYTEVLWAVRTRVPGSGRYGTWSRCEAPEVLEGFSSLPPAPLSPKQEAWWRRSAASVGLDPNGEVDRKNFAALPVLMNLRMRLN